MYFDMAGVDFLRLQGGSGTTRLLDPLDDNVLFSGAYDDGQAYFYQQSVALNQSYIIPFGRTFARAPIVYGALKLSQGLSQGTIQGTSQAVSFNTGDVIGPCRARAQNYSQLPHVNYAFAFTNNRSQISLETYGFVGVATFLVLDV